MPIISEKMWISLRKRFYRTPVRKAWQKLPRRIRQRVYENPFGSDQVPHVYLTLLCNLDCPYCSDGLAYDKSKMQYEGLSGTQWISVINALPGEAVIFTGGEPTLHPDLPMIVNGIRQPNVRIYTNLSYNVQKVLDKITKPVSVWGSFHPNNSEVTLEKYMKKVKILLEHPIILDASIHAIIEKSNGEREDFDQFQKAFNEAGIHLQLDEDQFFANNYGSQACDFNSKQTVQCTMNRMLVGPDGRRKICVSKMVRRAQDADVALDDSLPMIVCDEFGMCSPCDEVANIEFLEPQGQESVATTS